MITNRYWLEFFVAVELVSWPKPNWFLVFYSEVLRWFSLLAPYVLEPVLPWHLSVWVSKTHSLENMYCCWNFQIELKMRHEFSVIFSQNKMFNYSPTWWLLFADGLVWFVLVVRIVALESLLHRLVRFYSGFDSILAFFHPAWLCIVAPAVAVARAECCWWFVVRWFHHYSMFKQSDYYLIRTQSVYI